MSSVANREASGTAIVHPSPLLQHKIAALRRRHLIVAVLIGVSMAMAVNVELLALALFFDWWLDLPWAIRLASLIGQLAILTFIVLRMIVRPLVRQPDDDDLALMVERARPEFCGRLIASVQLTRAGAVPPGGSVGMIDALVEQTEAFAQAVDFPKIVPLERLHRFGMVALVVLIVGLGGFIYGRTMTVDLLKRVFLSSVPVPRKTRVIVPDGDKIIGRGDTVRLEAYVQGIVPTHGQVEVKYRSRRTHTYPLQQNRANKIHFAATIENVQDSFTYTVFLNDGRSATHTVTTVPRPTVATMECDQEFPAYTGLKPLKRALGDLSLLAGSVLRLNIVATKDLQNGAIQLSGVDAEIPLKLDPQQPRQLWGEFTVPAKGMNGFSISMLDTENMESRDSAVYRVDVIPDRPPVVKITYPERREELVTRHATMLVGIDVTDDFAVSKLRLRYKIHPGPIAPPSGEEPAEGTLELDLQQENPQRLRRRHEWRLGDLRPALSEGNTIEYWLEAEDNNNATGPGVTSSEHQLARIVSEAEKRADLLNRAGDYLGSISDVAADQEKLNRNLGALIREKTGLYR
ncbi:MAG: DUF4175 domain-containing protein [Verrucomicrobia subdivision 3 bacterium]|nr:DUF4175 domain-containing protein [Limisphaerales bacterium]